MKRILLAGVCVLFTSGAGAVYIHKEAVTDIWSWGHDDPLNHSPSEVASFGGDDSKYDGDEEDEAYLYNSEWVSRTTVNSFDQHYVFFYREGKPAGYTIYFQWRVGVAGGANVELYYWDGDSWVYITENEGTRAPDAEYTRVDQYFHYNQGEQQYYLHLLAVGDTSLNDKMARCDCGYLEVYEYGDGSTTTAVPGE